MASIYDWSMTASNNGNADSGIDFTEGQAPSTVNNSARALMARVAEWLADVSGTITAEGTADALTVTANSDFTTYANGRTVSFIAASDNTGAATLNVNAVGAKAIRRVTTSGDAALAAGAIQAGGVYTVVYNTAANGGAGAWLLVNPTLDALFQPLDSELSAIAGLTSAADKVPYFTGSGTAAVADFTSAGRALMDDADADAQLATLGGGATGIAIFKDTTAAAVRTEIELGTAATLDETTAAQYRANTADKVLSTDQVWSAMEVVSLTDAATITWDMSGGFDFSVTIAGNRTLGNPSNTQVGKKGRIKVTASGATRTLAKSSNIKSATSFPISISSGASAYLYYDCVSSTEIIVSVVEGVS